MCLLSNVGFISRSGSVTLIKRAWFKKRLIGEVMEWGVRDQEGAALKVKTLTRPQSSRKFKIIIHSVTTSLCLYFFPDMKTGMPAVFGACFNFLREYQRIPRHTLSLTRQQNHKLYCTSASPPRLYRMCDNYCGRNYSINIFNHEPTKNSK